MKRFFALTIVFLGLIGLTQIACAGPERMDKNVVPAPAPCDWSGFYIGLNVGVAGLNTTITDIDDWWSAASHTPEDTNFTGGGPIVFLGLIGLTQIACAGPERMDKNVVPAPAPCDWSGTTFLS